MITLKDKVMEIMSDGKPRTVKEVALILSANESHAGRVLRREYFKRKMKRYYGDAPRKPLVYCLSEEKK